MINIAWLAGFIDGEGCIRIVQQVKNNNSFTARMAITNTCFDILTSIQKEYGGTIHKLVKREDNWKQGYWLDITAKPMRKLLDDVFPYLVLKRNQAELVINLWKLQKQDQKRLSHIKEEKFCFEQIKKLNRRGI